jgi:hypothetical protein
MSTSLRVPLMLSILATVACGELIGIHDVPIPDDGGADATTPNDARGSSSGDDRDTGLASGDGPTQDAPVDEGPGADGPSMTIDGAMESAVPEAGAIEAGPDTGVDAAACALVWNPYANAGDCNACGIMLCCSELATCEAVDDAGPDMGTSFCGAFVTCVAGRKGSGTPAGNETLCEQQDVPVSPSERANADAALSCIRANCAACSGL